MSPKWPNFVLTADIPNCEAYILVFHCFHVKTWGATVWNYVKNSFLVAKNYETHDTTNCHGVSTNRRVTLYIPIVGIVVTISPSFSLYRIVVFPAASRPTIRILISFLPKSPENSLANALPMFQNFLIAPWKKTREDVRKQRVEKGAQYNARTFLCNCFGYLKNKGLSKWKTLRQICPAKNSTRRWID